MSFQWIIDNAESIIIDRRPVLATTQSRSGVVRTVSRGGQLWRFEVTLPSGPRWTDARPNIAKYEALGRLQTGTFKINHPGHAWLSKYQGTLNPGSMVANVPSSGNTITLTSGHTGTGYALRAGDFIQLGSSGSVYSVVNDVAAGSTSVTLHRPIIDPAGSTPLLVGPACQWKVRLADMPSFNIFARDQVSWTGPFVFVEDIE